MPRPTGTITRPGLASTWTSTLTSKVNIVTEKRFLLKKDAMKDAIIFYG